MANPYFNASGTPGTGTKTNSAGMRAEFAAVQAGFDKLPTLAGNTGKLLKIGSNNVVAEALTGAEAQAALSALPAPIVGGLDLGPTVTVISPGYAAVSAQLPLQGGAGNGGGLVLVRGASQSGVSFARLYLVAVHVAGGAAGVSALRVAGTGDATPDIGFSLGAGNYVYATISAGGNLTTFTTLGR